MFFQMSIQKVDRTSLGVLLSIAAIMLCFAANSIITRYLVLGGRIEPFPLTTIRFASGLVTLLILACFAPNSFKIETLSRRHFLGALFLGIYALSISYGYVFVPAAAGALVFYSFVVFSMSVYAVTMGKERLTTRLLLSQALGIIGVFVITFSKIGAVSFLGVLLMAITGVSWGMYSVYGTRFQNYFGYTYNSFLVFGLASLVMAPLDYLLVNHSEWQNISFSSFGLALYMGTISTALSYVVWNKVLKKVGTSTGGVAQLVVPIFTAIMGLVLLSEQISFSLVVGGLLVLIGIYANITRRKKSRV